MDALVWILFSIVRQQNTKRYKLEDSRSQLPWICVVWQGSWTIQLWTFRLESYRGGLQSFRGVSRVSTKCPLVAKFASRSLSRWKSSQTHVWLVLLTCETFTIKGRLLERKMMLQDNTRNIDLISECFSNIFYEWIVQSKIDSTYSFIIFNNFYSIDGLSWKMHIPDSDVVIICSCSTFSKDVSFIYSIEYRIRSRSSCMKQLETEPYSIFSVQYTILIFNRVFFLHHNTESEDCYNVWLNMFRRSNHLPSRDWPPPCTVITSRCKKTCLMDVHIA